MENRLPGWKRLTMVDALQAQKNKVFVMRPKIICHMISSVDGRLLVDRWSPSATPGYDTERQINTYYKAAAKLGGDGWIIGRETMERHFAKSVSRPAKSAVRGQRRTFVGNRAGRNLAIVFDSKGKLHYASDTVDGDHLVVVLGTAVADSYLSELRQLGISYVFAGPDGHDLPRAMDTLGRVFKVETLLLEGGGIINGAFLQAKLIDAISLLVYPGIDGLAGVPSIFEYNGKDTNTPADGLSLVHRATKTLAGGVVWLRYDVVPAPEKG